MVGILNHILEVGLQFLNLIPIQNFIVLVNDQYEIGSLIPFELGKTDTKVHEFLNHFP